MSKQINIGGRIHSTEVGNVSVGANEVFDDTKGKKQNVINSETDAELLRLDQSKQNNLTFDNTPTENSTNPVTSGGVYAANITLHELIEAILVLIPSAASALNQLADKAFVNSSVSTATATFRGTYNVVTDLELAYDATHEQIATKLGQVIATADNNDYAFVQVPVSATSTDIRRTERYKFNGTVWGYEYDLNTSGFTAAQWEAINSGITALLVSKLTNLPTAEVLATMFNAKQNVLTFDASPTALSTNPVYSGGVYAAIKAITDLIPSEATALNQLADKAYVLASILAATPAFKGQFTSLADLLDVASPKAGDLGIVRTKDSDGYDVFMFYQYLNNQWNVYFSLSYHPQTKPATTGTTGDYPYNGMGRIVLKKKYSENIDYANQPILEQADFDDDNNNHLTNTVFVIKYDFVLTEDITLGSGCVLEFDGGSITTHNPIILKNSSIIGSGEIIKAASDYTYPYIVKSSLSDTIKGIVIDANNNKTQCLALVNENETLAHFDCKVLNTTLKNASSEQVASISNITNNVVTTSSAHGLKTGDLIEIKNVVGGNPSGVSDLSAYNRLWYVNVISDTTFSIHDHLIGYSGDSTWFDGFSAYTSGGTVYKAGTGIAIYEKNAGSQYRTINVDNVTIDNCYIGIVCRTTESKYDNLNILNTGGRSIDICGGNNNIFNNLKVDNTIHLEFVHSQVFNNVVGRLSNKPLFRLLGYNSGGYTPGEVEDISIQNVDVSFDYNGLEAAMILCAARVNMCNCTIGCTGSYDFAKVIALQYSNFDNINFLSGECNMFAYGAGALSGVKVRNVYCTQFSDRGTIILRTSRIDFSGAQMDDDRYVTVDGTNLNVSGYNSENYIILKDISGTLDISKIRYSTVINCGKITNWSNTLENSIWNNHQEKVSLNGKRSYFRNTVVKRNISLAGGNNAAIPLGYFTSGTMNRAMTVVLDVMRSAYGYCSTYRIVVYISHSGTTFTLRKHTEMNNVTGTDPGVALNLIYGSKTISIDSDDTDIIESNVSPDTTTLISLKASGTPGIQTIADVSVLSEGHFNLDVLTEIS